MAELHGEKIDIIDWSEDPATFVGNALSPARVSGVTIVDAEARAAQVIVPDYQLSLAIGKEGQNARLAARLTGWRIDIRSDTAPIGGAGAHDTGPTELSLPEQAEMSPAGPTTG
jgi:N utilization substance protein A